MALGGDSEVIYRGRIRAGRPGALTSDSVEVHRCREYDIAFLGADAPRVDYQTDDYRETYDGAADVDTFFALHDEFAHRYLQLLEGVPLRGRVIADFGCGAGSFLDLVSGVAATTIGIEPHARFRAALASRGHRAYAFGADFLADGGEASVDVAVSLHVVEHVDAPLEFLTELHRALRPGGIALIATPNLHDVLLRLVGEPYQRFFFRTAHRWYFSGGGLARLAGEAGFLRVRVGYFQEYDLGNAFSWVRESKPMGNGSIPFLDTRLDRAWAASLEASGSASVVYLVAQRD